MLYCQAYSDWALAVQKLQTEGFTIEHAKRGTAVSPWFRIQRAAAEQVCRLSLDFGLTPASRAKLDVPPPAEAARAAKLDRFIGRFGIRPDTKPTTPGPDA